MEDRLHKLHSTIKNWWMPLLIGIGLIVLGVWVMRNPGGTLLGLVTLVNLMLMVSGLVTIAFAMSNRANIAGKSPSSRCSDEPLSRGDRR